MMRYHINKSRLLRDGVLAPRIAIIIAQIILLTFSSVAAEISNGTITGKVLDKVTKQPIPSVNVLVVGTMHGSATDLNGKFMIQGVEENVYKLKYSSVGYASHIVAFLDILNLYNRLNVSDEQFNEITGRNT